MTNLRLIALSFVFLLSVSAYADRGALSVDASGGETALLLPSPLAASHNATLGFAPAFLLGARYALVNAFEVTFSAFFEIPVTYFENGTTTVADGSLFPGTLSHTLTRYGGHLGGRFVHGYAWRTVLGAEIGWSRRVYTHFDVIDDACPDNPVSYGLTIPKAVRDNASIALVAGVEWAGGDHWSVSLLPRFEMLPGSDGTVAFTLPLSLAWDFYL
jgi:hypothetical protein